ncbi:uncharacterized protein LOC117564224 [Drosophila albomicans]|uniref:Uncharacterized protein LOC117564224 n=1 Tax=Drosophila albomicans TaxID=7291 RepID=A0A6P8XJD1_DROAB|nr:uncharacterized protein LOC117564224 [Drosophila albomicans]XP_034098803.1 uncharacterized protein LOC117564224 [Drosophila albomicans]
MQINEDIDMSHREDTVNHQLKTSEKTAQKASEEIAKDTIEAELLSMEGSNAKEAYFASLAEWTRQAHEWNSFVNFVNSSFSIYLRNRSLANRSRRVMWTPQLREGRHRIDLQAVVELDGLPRQRLIWGLGGVEMLVAPFWKRTLAEIFDAFITILMKILVAFMFISFTSVDEKLPVVRISLLAEENFVLSFLEDLQAIFQLSLATVCLIVVMKLLVFWYEYLFLKYNHGMTPGKYLMNIRVIYVRTVIPLRPRPAPAYIYQVLSEPYYAFVYPAITPNARRILARVILKNFIIHCSFPFCLLLIFPRDNRTTYDFAAKTVVVEAGTERRPTANRFDVRRRGH